MKLLHIGILLSLLLTLSLFSCKEDDPLTPGNGMLEVAAGTFPTLGLDVQVFAPDTLIVGYNELYVALRDQQGEAMTQAEVDLRPMMYMQTMNHSAPVSLPEQAGASEGLFRRDIVFIMPSGQMGYWELMLKVKDLSTGQEEEIALSVDIKLPAEQVMKSFPSEIDQTGIFVSLLEPREPVVGLNDLVLTVHQRANMMNFPAMTELNVAIEPEMPTMGHGSDGNVDPTHLRDGKYAGKVFFNMPGLWRIHLTLTDREGTQIGKTSFDMTF